MQQNLKIYVADLAAYNNGIEHGIWLDALADIEELYQQIYTTLAKSPIPDTEEFEIHCYDGYSGFCNRSPPQHRDSPRNCILSSRTLSSRTRRI